MNLPTRSFTDLVRDMCAAITASATDLLDMSIGSVLRALIEANAAIVLWAQWLALLTLQTTRAATSTGPDLDSWMADFSLSRLPAIASTGSVTFSRFSGINSSFVPAGTVVKTQDGSLSFSVVNDATNPAWQGTISAYTLASGVTSLELPVIASLAGSLGNVLPNTITLLASAVPGIDYINNNFATIGGADAETDDAFRVRFSDYFASRSRATMDAIGYAISQVNSGLSYLVLENVDPAQSSSIGTILIIVNDGSGSLSTELFNSLSQAVNMVRPVGTKFFIQPPLVSEAQIAMSLEYAEGVTLSSVQNSVQASIQTYIGGLAIGATLSITKLSQIAYNTDSSIINISNVMLNGNSTDLVVSPTTVIIFDSLEFT